MCTSKLRTFGFGLSILLASASAWAAGKPPGHFNGKKIVALGLVHGGKIELPDQFMHDFDDEIQASLTTYLTLSGKYIVADANPRFSLQSGGASEEYRWSGSVTPSATVRL